MLGIDRRSISQARYQRCHGFPNDARNRRKRKETNRYGWVSDTMGALGHGKQNLYARTSASYGSSHWRNESPRQRLTLEAAGCPIALAAELKTIAKKHAAELAEAMKFNRANSRIGRCLGDSSTDIAFARRLWRLHNANSFDLLGPEYLGWRSVNLVWVKTSPSNI